MSVSLNGGNLKPRPARGFVVFKWLVYGLLAIDVALYTAFGRATELLDTAAWALLLALFELETGGWRIGATTRRATGVVRLAAAFGIVGAVIGYAFEREWLDFANGVTWVAVVALLEAEVRCPHARWLQHWRVRIAFVLYTMLVLFAVTWLGHGLEAGEARGAWLDAADAILWLVAFAAIELNVFGWSQSSLPQMKSSPARR